MFPLKPFEVVVRIDIVLPKLSNDVLTDITVILLDLLRNLKLILRRDNNRLSALAKESLHETGDITTGDRNMLDCASNDITLRAGNNVRDTIARIDDCSRESAVGDFIGGPGCGQCEHGLDGDVETLDVERLEEDLGGVLAVLGRVKRRFRLLKRQMVLISGT